MAICYGLQYQELLRKTIDEVTRTRLNVFDADRELSRPNQKRLWPEKLLDAKANYEAARTILDARIYASPPEAVEEFHRDTGAYPI